ncbi:MAG: hypothetical protein CK424_08635 [Legionella sp.]|nr:MAG: hypothetical protein CK424_08635 [Legionella sp.]
MPKFGVRAIHYGLFGAAGSALLAVPQMVRRFEDTVQGKDGFSQHTRLEHAAHYISGMHTPLMPTQAQQAHFRKHYLEHVHLLPTKLDEFRRQQSLKTPVKIKALSECPKVLPYDNAGTLVVGGLPALISAASCIKKDNKLTYINDERRWPIAYGSAWHLEQDAESEAPTSYKPSDFMVDQIKRATIGYVPLSNIEKTGLFPWKTLDWIGWIHHPQLWMPGIKLAIHFQMAAMASPTQRQAMLQKLAIQCQANEKFYDALNREVGGHLLLSGKGSVIVARTEAEVSDLLAMKHNLAKEHRELTVLSKEDMKKRYGFVPSGLMFGEKAHDRILSPNYMRILTRYLKKQGGCVVDGTLTTIYVDPHTAGGIAEYQTSGGTSVLLPFSRLIMSLGSQPILDEKDKPLFDVVAARGVSVLAYVTVPRGYQLPPALVCGGTNHVTKLSERPVVVKGTDGKAYEQYLMRMTAGACITPNVSEKMVADYDASVAVGLVAAVRQTLGDCEIEPITVYGCNRQVSQHGQTNWMNPYPGIHIQYGAGGGGLTRAPDFAVQEEQSMVSSPRNRM